MGAFFVYAERLRETLEFEAPVERFNAGAASTSCPRFVLAADNGYSTDFRKNIKYGCVVKIQKEEKTISLVLGSGGARGLAYIGVIHWLHEKVMKFVSSIKPSELDADSHDWGAYDIANQAFDAMQSTIARQKIAAYPPDHVIEISRNACGTLEFDRAAEMIELGYKKAQQSLSKLLNKE